ncbi:MAG: nitroreductase family protein [Alphaproteobacteria bacterium]|nr:MAG: nitroreductase family protein [Alphaproteobacteria bacterium]
MSAGTFEPLKGYDELTNAQRVSRAEHFSKAMENRRTVRDFSDKPVPREIIDCAIRTAGLAPNGANMQPWHFVVVSDPEIKAKIRAAAEEEERAFYGGKASDEWLEALAPLGTDANKPFLETAPYLIVVFQQSYGLTEAGERVKHYYVQESVGIACGFLLSALHMAGLATLTHTPSPMGFLRDILRRPKNEKAMMIIVAGHPAKGAQVPRISKKPFDEICSSF